MRKSVAAFVTVFLALVLGCVEPPASPTSDIGESTVPSAKAPLIEFSVAPWSPTSAIPGVSLNPTTAKSDRGRYPVWTRQFGTSSYDQIGGAAADQQGNVYVVGYSSPAGYPQAFVTKYNGDGGEEWTTQIASSVAAGAALDPSGNVYVAGSTSQHLPGQISFGSGDAFIRKYNPNGIEQWTHQFGTERSDEAHAVATDPTGNVYVVGATYGTLPGQSARGSYDGFLKKYDQNGNEQRTRQFGTAGSDAAAGTATDEVGNVYVVGTTYGAFAGQTLLGDYDAFITKYDPDGKELWTNQFGSSDGDSAMGVTGDRGGRVYVVGYANGLLPGQSVLGIPGGFVRKYDYNGEERWTRQTKWSGTFCATANQEGDIYVGGAMGGTFQGSDGFVRKYDATGDEEWTLRFGSSSDNVTYTNVMAIAAQGVQNVFVAGYTNGALAGQTFFGDRDAYLQKYDVDAD